MLDMTEMPRPEQMYMDDHGARIRIISVEENRVVFMRDGSPYPCMRPMNNFLSKFKKLPNKPIE